MALRILSYNIHGLPWITCPIEAILLWTQFQCPCDILCLQEVFSKNLCTKIIALAPLYNFQVIFASSESDCIGKSALGFYTPCGLCILVKNNIPIVKEPQFTRFHNKAGLDTLVNKGFLSVGIEYMGNPLQIYNTHFQSDFDELPCISFRYQYIRSSQESQLYFHTLENEFPIICGDFNTNKFRFFEMFDRNYSITFPATGQHLDHMLLPQHLLSTIKSKKVTYFHKIKFSDHIPIVFEFTL